MVLYYSEKAVEYTDRNFVRISKRKLSKIKSWAIESYQCTTQLWQKYSGDQIKNWSMFVFIFFLIHSISKEI